MDKSYQDILDNLKQTPPRKINDKVLVVDALNTFIRAFSMLKSLNPKGQHIGGLIGFLRSLGYLVRIHEPTRVILVFDGKGSSINRRNIDPNYKANRDNLKVTNWGMFDSREEERESMAIQMRRLLDYLDCLPLQLVSLEKVEADDIISYLGQEFSSRGSNVIIVSSDKDFLQLIRPNLDIYAPIKKKLITSTNIKEEFSILPENYLIVKALSGDNSDNLRGVKGAGVKTLSRMFPELSKKPVNLDYIYNLCEENIDKRKIFARIIHDWDIVQRNYNLMNLLTPRLSDDEKIHIIEELKKPVSKLNTGAFLHHLDQDGIEGITKNTDAWLEQFRELTFY